MTTIIQNFTLVSLVNFYLNTLSSLVFIKILNSPQPIYSIFPYSIHLISHLLHYKVDKTSIYKSEKYFALIFIYKLSIYQGMSLLF